MNYIKENKLLLEKYLFIIILNIIYYILANFYIKNNSEIILMLAVIVSDLFIYYYKEKIVFKYYLDIIANFIIGLALMLFIKDIYNYSVIMFCLFFSNNIIFMKSRFSDNFWKRSLQYLIIVLLTTLSTFINLLIFKILIG